MNQLLDDPAYVANYFISIIPIAFLLNWMYYRNRRSVLAVWALHVSADIFADLFRAGQPAKIVQTLLMFAVVTVLVAVDRRLFTDRGPVPLGR